METPSGPVAPSLIVSGRGEPRETLALPTYLALLTTVRRGLLLKPLQAKEWLKKMHAYSEHYQALKRGGTLWVAATQMSLEDTMLN